MKAAEKAETVKGAKKPGKAQVSQKKTAASVSGGKGGKNAKPVKAKTKNNLPLIIIVSALSVILIFFIVLIILLLSGKAPNALTRAINRSKATGLFEDYLYQETGSKINLTKVKKEIISEEELGYYNDVVEPFSEDPGIIAQWFEYLRMDEWDFAMANEDIMLDIETSDTDMLLALCSIHGYPQFYQDYGYLVDENFEEEEEEVEEEEPEELIEEEPEEEEIIEEEPEEEIVSEDEAEEVTDEELFEDYTDSEEEETLSEDEAELEDEELEDEWIDEEETEDESTEEDTGYVVQEMPLAPTQ